MLNQKTGNRELCYIVKIDEIKPIEGSDNCECAVVGGWHVMVRKGQYQPGDKAVYFEIDSLVPSDNEAFAFLANRKFRVKTQRYTFGGKGLMVSQGLLMTLEELGVGGEIGDFLTERLGVTYYEAEDRARKITVDPYRSMIDRHKDLFKKPWVKWLMRRTWGRKLMFTFFGKKKSSSWPAHIAVKTDVERVQNCMWVLKDKQAYVATEKVDGTSCSVMIERSKWGRLKYYVCSRNVVFEDTNKACWYDTNVYFEAFEKYNLKEVITNLYRDLGCKTLALQMEIYGDGIQKRDYSLKNGEHQIAVFHIVMDGVKLPMDETVRLCEAYGVPHVPIIDANYILPDTIEELQQYVESAPSAIDGLPKEGIVFYDKKTGQQYFKFVSPEFLMAYH